MHDIALPRLFLIVALSVIAAAGCVRTERTGDAPSKVATTTAMSSDETSDWRAGYPAHWWEPVPTEGAPAWEILPQAAGRGEVILSKRHELGILSNFAPTPFTYRGVRYASLEGFWQMMLYPEGPDDPRALAAGAAADADAAEGGAARVEGVAWEFTRDQVAAMTAFEAKAAGDRAFKNMRAMGIDWVSFEGRRFPYWSHEPDSEHYRLIVDAMRAKLEQNDEVRRVLLSTGDLILRPDHHQEPSAPPEWRYFEIWMRVRDELRAEDDRATR